jgi:predicted transcriptional regulator
MAVLQLGTNCDPIGATPEQQATKMDIVLRHERMMLARLFFEEAHALHQAHFGIHPGLRFGTSLELSIVGRAVFLGQAEGKPMGIAQLSRFLDMPRATLRRKLRMLEKLGYIERQGNAYLCRIEAINCPEVLRSFDKARKLVLATCAGLNKT